MSYHCYHCNISFKQIAAEDITEFFVQMKKTVTHNFKAIAKDEFIFSPYIKKSFEEKSCDSRKQFDFDVETVSWAKEYLFKYRWFYIKESKLLGIFNVPNCLTDLFDSTIYFQNYCDQDYDFDTWGKIPCFKNICDDWLAKDVEQVKSYLIKEFNWLETDRDLNDTSTYTYWLKTIIYKDCWSKVSCYLFDDSCCTAISLFNNCELDVLGDFLDMVRDEYVCWLNSCKSVSETADDVSELLADLAIEQREQM